MLQAAFRTPDLFHARVNAYSDCAISVASLEIWLVNAIKLRLICVNFVVCICSRCKLQALDIHLCHGMVIQHEKRKTCMGGLLFNPSPSLTQQQKKMNSTRSPVVLCLSKKATSESAEGHYQSRCGTIKISLSTTAISGKQRAKQQTLFYLSSTLSPLIQIHMYILPSLCQNPRIHCIYSE